MVYLPYYTRPSLMKYSIIFIFLLFISQYTFAQETKARDMVIDSTLILVDSVITLPKKQEVIILKQPKYLSPKPTEQSFEVLDKSPASPQITKRFTKHLKNKPFKKNTDLTNGEKLAFWGLMIMYIGVAFFPIKRVKSFKQANISFFFGLISSFLAFPILIDFIKYKENKVYSRFSFIRAFQELFDTLIQIFLVSWLGGSLMALFIGILFHVWVLWNLAFSTAIIIGASLLVLGILFFVGAYFIDR